MAVSIICPTLNEAKSIGPWCENALQFSRDVIVLDGGSTDGTREIVKGFPGVQLLTYEQKDLPYEWNEGIVRNSMIDMCSEEWVIEGGADEFYDDNMASAVHELSKSSKHFISFPYLDFWYSPKTVRARDIRKGFWDWKRFHPSRRVRMFRNTPKIRYRERKQTEGKHTFLEFNGLGKSAWRASHLKSDIQIYHYHFCLGLKENDNRKSDYGTTGIRLETYFGSHPRAAENLWKD